MTKYTACKPLINRNPELVPDHDLCLPTRRLTHEELAKLVKESNEVHTKKTIRAPAISFSELDFEELELEFG